MDILNENSESWLQLILPVGHYRVQEILNHCRISVLLFCWSDQSFQQHGNCINYIKYNITMWNKLTDKQLSVFSSLPWGEKKEQPYKTCKTQQ